jgi:hypothetical protein
MFPGSESPPGTPTAIHALPARRGIAWIAGGLRLLGRQPFLLTAIVSFGPLFLLALGFIPWAGAALAPLLAPVISQGMLAACRTTESGAAPSFEDYLAAPRQRAVRIELLRLGLVYLAALTLVSLLWYVLAPAAPAAAPAALPPVPPAQAPGVDAAAASAAVDAAPALPGPEYLPPLLACALLWIPLQMVMWFAPPLVAWHGMRATKAMFFSFFACWRNAGAMTVYGLGMAGVMLLMAMFFGTLVDLLGLGLAPAQFLLAPMALGIAALLQASNLRIYREVVQPAAPVREPAAGEPPPAAAP